MLKKSPLIAIVIPCYNEEEVINIAFEEINRVLDNLIKNNEIDKRSYIVFVDDGSTDRTWELIKKLHEKFPERVKGLKLSKIGDIRTP